MLSGKGSCVPQTPRRSAQKQPSLKESVTAHWPRDMAPKIHEAEAYYRRQGFPAYSYAGSGRGAFLLRRSRSGRNGGAIRSENAGMSSEKLVRI